ncbi:MAG: CoA transferase subunit A [Rhizobiaceae bacterium]|nr:CoA transferase subunit A [Rhizobiaceae bacterium]
MSNKFMSLPDAVAKYVKDGQVIALEGFTHLIPHAAAHEIIRQGRKDLTAIRMTPDIIYDQMVGMGCIKKLIFSFMGNPGVGLLKRVRDSIEHEYPSAITYEEYSHSAMANAYEAGAAGLPCAIFRGFLGADLAKVNPNIKHVICPFTGEKLAAIPSVQPEVTVIHAQRANKRGEVLIEGIIGIQKEAVLAANTAIVTVEEIVDNFDDMHPNTCILPHFVVDAICVVPGGAHPSYTHNYYQRDNVAYKEWAKISADRDLFAKWMEENVMNVGPEVFEGRVAHLRGEK